MKESVGMEQRMVFIGAGNMAEALVSGLLRRGLSKADRIRVTDIRAERCTYFRETYGVEGSDDNVSAARDADMVVLAVKPQGLQEVLRGLRPVLGARHLVISIAAGVRVADIEAALESGVRVVRAMPNTPALVGRGVAAICPGAHAADADLDLAEQVLGATGLVVRVTESQMDAVTAVSGSGPAYVFYLMEAMQQAAQDLGLDEALAIRLITGTVEGAARLVAETGRTPAELRGQVTSKGGTTAAALSVMDDAAVREHLVAAVHAAQRRARELSSET